MLGFSPLSQGPVGTSGGVSGDITVSVSGVAATGQVGSVTPSLPVTVLLSGWGFGAWNQNSWGINGILPIATGAVGTVSLELNTTVDVTGVEARGAFGIGWGGGAWGANTCYTIWYCKGSSTRRSKLIFPRRVGWYVKIYIGRFNIPNTYLIACPKVFKSNHSTIKPITLTHL